MAGTTQIADAFCSGTTATLGIILATMMIAWTSSAPMERTVLTSGTAEIARTMIGKRTKIGTITARIGMEVTRTATIMIASYIVVTDKIALAVATRAMEQQVV